MATERRVSWLISANVKQWQKGLNKAQRRMDRFGRKMQRAGRSLTRSITVPIGAAAAASIKMASDFESSMTRIETLVGLSREQVQGMREDVLRLAGETGRAPKELSEALFAVTSAGLRGAQSMEVLERAAKASAIGLGQTREIARATTAILQAYGEENINAAEATDTLTAIVREGNLEASELAPVLGRVVGIASQLDVSFAEVGASIATFTRLGVSAEEAVTGLRGIMNALLKPTEQGRKALDKVGLSFKELRQQVSEDGLTAVLRRLIAAFDGNVEGLSKVIPRVRALAAVMGTAGAQGEQYSQILNNISNAAGIVDEGFEKVAETTQFKFDKALSNLKATGIELGTVMLPMVNNLLEGISKLAKRFQGLSKEVRIQAVLYAGLAAAAGPLLIVFGKMVSGLAAILSPAFLAQAALVGLFAATVTTGQWFVDIWDKISQGFSNAMTTMTITAKKMSRGVLRAIKQVVSTIVDLPAGLATSVFGIDLSEITADFTGINTRLQALTEDIENGSKRLSEGIARYNDLEWGSIGESASHALELAKNTLIRGLKGILNSSQIQSLIEQINNMMSASGGPSEAGSGGPSEAGSEDQGSEDQGKVSIPFVDNIKSQSDKFVRGLEKMKIATTEFSGVFKAAFGTSREEMRAFADEYGVAVSDIMGMTEEELKKFAAVMNQFSQIMEGVLEDVIISFSKSLGQLASGASSLKDVAVGLINILADMMIQIGALWISFGIGWAAAMNPATLFATAGTSAIVAGTALIATAVALKSIFSNTKKNATSVNDALVRSDGSIVNFHPDDNILAMKDFSKLGMAAGGKQVIHNQLNLDGQVVWQNQRRVQTDRGR